MKTTINVTRRDEGQHRLVATGAATDPMVTVGASGRNTSGKHLVAVEVTIVPDGGPPAPVRRADARDIEATRRAQEEDAAMAAEDVLTQAEEAGALDPVG